MSPEAAGRIRGTVVKVPDANPGLLFANGQQKSFVMEGVWRSPQAPAPNMTVDVEVDGGGRITGITAVDPQQIARERMQQLSGVAQERGKEAAKLAQQGVGALAARMGKVALGATVLVWIAWFFLPAATFGGGLTAAANLTFWNLLGIDFNSPLAVLGNASEHGFLAFLGLACIVAPFVAPFITAPWSKYLNAAPLGIVAVGFIAIYMEENKAFGELTKLGAPSPFSWSWGIFVLGVAALVLAGGALKKPAA